MSDLEYKLGGMDIDSNGLILGPGDINPLHRFLVREEGDTLSIYIAHIKLPYLPCPISLAPDPRYRYVIREFGFDPNDESIIGGGELFMRDSGQLIFMGGAPNYGAIPNQVAQEFGKLLLPELKKLGFEIKEISTEINEVFLNRYWKELGFPK